LLNYIYALGNGFDNGNGVESTGDGWEFRGRGLKQITGRGNYKMISTILKDIFPAEYNKLPEANRGEEKLESHPEKVEEVDYAVITAIAFWEKNSIWELADKGLLVSE
jgi:predicted chitinase